MKKIFFDLETTGLVKGKHGIHQIAMLIELDGVIVRKVDLKLKPASTLVVDPKALEIAGVTPEDLETYPESSKVYKKMIALLSKHIDRFDRKDKAFLVGYNNRGFDDGFLRAWFEQNDDPYFGSWFWSDSRDVLVLASEYLGDRRANMPNFKLGSVAKELGLSVDDGNLHDGMYDVELTRSIYRIVTGIDFEI